MIPTSTTPPTQAGTYWFKQKKSPYEVMVEVRRIQKDGPLTVRLSSNDDVPVTEMRGTWRGPVKPLRR